MKFYQKAILFSFLLHFCLASFLFFSPIQHSSKNYVVKKSPVSKKQIIQTTAIDSLQVEQEIARIQVQKNQQKIKRQKEQEKFEHAVKQARLQRQMEEKNIDKLKAQQLELKKLNKHQLRRQKNKVLALKKKRRIEKELLLRGQKRLKDLKEYIAKERAKQAKEKELEQLELAKQKAKQLKEQQQLVNAEVNKYKTLIINAISQNWILPSGVDTSLSCRFEIQLANTGQVLSVKLIKTSGDPVLDRSAQTAIYRASPLPVPATPQAFEVFKIVKLTVIPSTGII